MSFNTTNIGNQTPEDIIDSAYGTDQKGELFVSTGTGFNLLQVGNNNQILTCDDNEVLGVKWADLTIPSSGLSYKGTWDAATNTPTLVSSTGTPGHYYICSFGGVTNLNGITDWQVYDWALFSDSGVWQKLDHSSFTSHNQLSDIGFNSHALIDAHIADLTKHRIINDSGASTTELWSSSRINTLLLGVPGSGTFILNGCAQNPSGASLTVVNLSGDGTIGPADPSVSFPYNIEIIGISVNMLFNASLAINAGSSFEFSAYKGQITNDSLLSLATKITSSTIIISSADNGTKPVKYVDYSVSPLSINTGERLFYAVDRPLTVGQSGADFSISIICRIPALNAQLLQSYPLNDITDVSLGTLSHGDALLYNSGTTHWENAQIIQGILGTANSVTVTNFSTPTINVPKISSNRIDLSDSLTATSIRDNGAGFELVEGAQTRFRIPRLTTGVSAGFENYSSCMTIPFGTTAQRVDASYGIRFNTELIQYEGYNGTSWVKLDSQGGVLTVTSANSSVTIGGTGTDPTISVPKLATTDTVWVSEDVADWNLFDSGSSLQIRKATTTRWALSDNLNDSLVGFNPIANYTGSMMIPAGTTAQRNTVPTIGALRYNTTNQVFEWYNGSTWTSPSTYTPDTQNVRVGLGANANGSLATAVGYIATSAQEFATAVGPYAQAGLRSCSLGYAASQLTASSYSVSIGAEAARSSTAGNNVNIGAHCGGASGNVVNVGYFCGAGGAGTNGVRLGSLCCRNTNQNNIVALNGTGVALDPATANAFYVKPIRNASASNKLQYDTTTGEISYVSDIVNTDKGISDIFTINGTFSLNTSGVVLPINTLKHGTNFTLATDTLTCVNAGTYLISYVSRYKAEVNSNARDWYLDCRKNGISIEVTGLIRVNKNGETLTIGDIPDYGVPISFETEATLVATDTIDFTMLFSATASLNATQRGYLKIIKLS